MHGAQLLERARGALLGAIPSDVGQRLDQRPHGVAEPGVEAMFGERLDRRAAGGNKRGVEATPLWRLPGLSGRPGRVVGSWKRPGGFSPFGPLAASFLMRLRECG